MDMTDTRRLALPRARRLTRWLTGDGAPPSLRAQLVLLLSAFLLGCVVAALLFVGIWRHTAAEGARVRTAQLADRRHLAAAQRQLALAQAELTRERTTLAAARKRAAELAATVTRTRAAGRALTPRLQGIAAAAATLEHDTSRLQSELATLRTYVRNPGAAGLDSGYLLTQARYVVDSAHAAAAAAATLSTQARDAQATAGKLQRSAR